MIPIKHSAIFRSRWMALIWAAGIIWFAYDFAGPSAQDENSATSDQVQITDANGTPVSPDEAKQLSEALNRV
jgi:hypothetical protein